MSFKTTGILFIILIIVAAYYYIFEVVGHKKKEAEKEAAQQLFQFETDSVNFLKVKNQYGEFEFQKIQGEWRITKPLYTDAEENLITSALNNLKNAKKDKEFSVTPDKRKDYGLGEKSVNVWVALKNGSVDSLDLGDKTPVGSSVFVSNLDTMVFTIPQYIKTSLDKKLFDWRNKNLLRFKRNDVQRMVIRKSGLKYEFEKKGGSDWDFRTINRPANTSMMSSILNKLENNKAKEFVDEEGTSLAKYGLTNPAYQIDLFLGENQGKKSLTISREIKKKYYAKDDSRKPIFEIDSTLVKDIRKPESDFRDKKLAKIVQNSINRAVIDYNDTLLTCVKDTANEWHLEDPEKSLVKNSEMTSFLSNINNATISEFVSDEPKSIAGYGFENPNLKIQLFDGDSKTLEIKFGKLKDKNVYAMTDQYNSVYLLSKNQYSRLKLKRDKIVEKPVSLNDSTISSPN